MMYIVVSELNHQEVYATGFYGESGKQKAEEKIKSGYFHKYLVEELKGVKLIVIEK